METVLHNSSWSIEKHAACPPSWLHLMLGSAVSSSTVASAPPLVNSLESRGPLLPSGWEALIDPTGRPYYGNPALRITQYQHPDEQTARLYQSAMLHAQRPDVLRPLDAARPCFGSSQMELQEMNTAAPACALCGCVARTRTAAATS
jgi:hypothetical protein